MADWSELSADLDEAVDSLLGDTLSVSTNAGATWRDVQGFVLPVGHSLNVGSIDEPLGSRPRIKLKRDLFANGIPPRTLRIKHATLGADTYRPAGSEPQEQGRYVIFDVQKV